MGARPRIPSVRFWLGSGARKGRSAGRDTAFWAPPCMASAPQPVFLAVTPRVRCSACTRCRSVEQLAEQFVCTEDRHEERESAARRFPCWPPPPPLAESLVIAQSSRHSQKLGSAVHPSVPKPALRGCRRLKPGVSQYEEEEARLC